jgi:hypothetical protein
VTRASDGATTASGSLQHGISRVTAARKTARNEEARS